MHLLNTAFSLNSTLVGGALHFFQGARTSESHVWLRSSPIMTSGVFNYLRSALRPHAETSRKNLTALQEKIRQLHGCQAHHVKTVRVEKDFRGSDKWTCDVELFELLGHPTAKRCYAWSLMDDIGLREVAVVLELPPVTSAESAVRTEIYSRSR